MLKNKRRAPDTLICVFGILLTLTISTGLVFERTVPGLWIVAYSALFSGTALLGLLLYDEPAGWTNPPKLVGLISIGLLAYILTWSDMWHDIGWQNTRTGWQHKSWGIIADLSITLLFIGGWIMALFKIRRTQSMESITLAIFPIIGILAFIIGSAGGNETNTLTAIIYNVFMLFYGLMYVVLGCRNVKFRQLNGGMALLALLLVTRFFDADFGFFARGFVFILLGICFLTVNLIMAKRKKIRKVAS
ncbi:MAG: hypothetical protein V5783_06540 [Pontiella sp.]